MVRRPPLAGILAAFFLAAVCTVSIGAQAADHQRIGVERKTAWELGIETGSGATHETYGGIDYFVIDSYLSIDVLAARTWTASVYLPLATCIPVILYLGVA